MSIFKCPSIRKDNGHLTKSSPTKLDQAINRVPQSLEAPYVKHINTITSSGNHYLLPHHHNNFSSILAPFDMLQQWSRTPPVPSASQVAHSPKTRTGNSEAQDAEEAIQPGTLDADDVTTQQSTQKPVALALINQKPKNPNPR